MERHSRMTAEHRTQQRAMAKEAVSRLARMRPGQRRWAVKNVPELRSYEGLLLCVERCREALWMDLRDAECWSECAQGILDSLPEDLPDCLQTDGRILAQMESANIYRVGGEFAAAWETIRSAHEDWRSSSSGDPLLLARICSISASLEAAVGRMSDAVEFINRATAIYSEVGDHLQLIKSMIKRSTYYSRMREYERAIRVVQYGLELASHHSASIPLDEYGSLLFCAHYNTIHYMIYLDAHKARKVFDRNRQHLLTFNSSEGAKTQILWMDADLRRMEGDAPSAGALYRAVWKNLIKQGAHAKCALVAADLAACMLESGDYQDAMVVLEEIGNFYSSVDGLSREILTAVDSMWRAARDGILTIEIVRHYREHLGGLIRG